MKVVVAIVSWIIDSRGGRLLGNSPYVSGIAAGLLCSLVGPDWKDAALGFGLYALGIVTAASAAAIELDKLGKAE